ncbi:hypothetical protein LEP1GSC090_3063 [Leptospira borgpetersenii serovar Javanica str. MK146]|nr:hypothetical protein LEP1GSC090_3063 [Leptospira borgpetersenii serovar Javanica str. MK146]
MLLKIFCTCSGIADLHRIYNTGHNQISERKYNLFSNFFKKFSSGYTSVKFLKKREFDKVLSQFWNRTLQLDLSDKAEN